MRVRTFLAVMLLLAGSVSLLWAQPKQDRLRLHQELKLTDQQKEKLQDLHFSTAKEMIQLRSQLQLARLDLHRMLAEENPEREMIFDQIEKISRIQGEMKKVQIEKQLTFREILDKKQLAKLKELRMERKHLFRQKRFKHGPGRGPGFGPGRAMSGEIPAEPEVGMVPEPNVPPIPEDEVAPEMGLLFGAFPEFDLMDEPIPPMEELPEIE